MKVWVVLGAGAFVWLASACSRGPEIHITSQPPAAAADIRVEGDSGSATWTWGHGDLKEKIIAVADSRSKRGGHPADGDIRLTLEDGTVLRLAQQRSFFICQAGCEKKHMPITWVSAAYE
ncbi:hypothetical protein [Luteibacter yeojuensis]|uniref:Lipoprotein n=1 Tax=Luteibacter yeojuensis TaxID=345309 RepID=A0A0F3KXD6_9GAMM|nr:hypothetical protein [Luteibacter yeojuensis]KJV34774.1 hypothetical protein VI08_09300 [Luteibacter yeojuensis]